MTPDAGPAGTAPARDRHAANGTTPWRRVLASTAIVAGLALLGIAGFLALRHAQAPPAYRYVVGGIIAPANLGPLAPLAGRGVAVHSGTVVGADGKAFADFTFAASKSGPVLLDWQPKIDPPFLSMPVPTSEIADLAPVLGRHVNTGEPVLAWWDTSRALGLLVDADLPLRATVGVPLFIPRQWHDRTAGVEAIESSFWKLTSDTAARTRFDRFTNALLANETDGIAALRELAGGKPAVLVLNVRDVLLLGQIAPARIGVAFRDFPNSGDVHGMVPAVYGWMREHGYPSYTVVRARDGTEVRAIALTDAASGKTLAARLLPFVGNEQSAVPGTVLVFKTGGFWVYRIEPAATPPPATGRAAP